MRHAHISLCPTALLCFVACGATAEVALVGTPRAAGADGVAQVEEIEGGNRLITLVMSHLPPPDRIGPELTTYCVWVQAGEAPAALAGRLDYDSDSREGRLTATTPNATFDLIVTAQASGTESEPSEFVVARHHIAP